ncbi:hypothetical protein TthSNM76_24890 (plasmid) [Thermus thermophilus]|nr:hypothetical protein TthSNM76_24890 [Thermus thermophilus]
MRVRWPKRRSRKEERGRTNFPGPEVVVSRSGITAPQARARPSRRPTSTPRPLRRLAVRAAPARWVPAVIA